MSIIGSIASTLAHTLSGQPVAPARADESPSFGLLVLTLQQLQASKRAQYRQVSGQLAASLRSAAETTQAGGDATGANELRKLASGFAIAAATGHLPNLQDLSVTTRHLAQAS